MNQTQAAGEANYSGLDRNHTPASGDYDQAETIQLNGDFKWI
jgi:hypothetical protein